LAKPPNPKAPEKKCYFCEKVGLVQDCPQRRSESAGRLPQKPKPTHTKQVTVSEGRSENAESTGVDPLDLLYSSEEKETEVCLVRVSDEGSQVQCAQVKVQGVV